MMIAIVMTLSLAACGDGDQDGYDQVTLEFMGWEASPLETDAVQGGIEAFEYQFPHITIEYIVSPGGDDYHARLLTMVAGDAVPDVFFLGSDQYRPFAERGALLNVTDRFDDEFRLDDFLASARAIMSIDGQIYGIQSCIVTPVLFFNKDIFDAAGVAYPGTTAMPWEEFRQMAIALTTDEIFGAYGHEIFWNALNLFLESGGAALYNHDMSASAINSPEAREVFLALRGLRTEDNAAAAAVALEQVGMNPAQMLATGRVAMLVDGSWALQELAQMDFRLGVAPVPHFGMPHNTAQAHLHSISATTDHPDEAWEFLKFLSGMDYQGALVRAGLWMPNRYSMYEREAVDQWYVEDIHGAYIYFLDYFMNSAVQINALARSAMIMDILGEETDVFFLDDGDVDIMLQNIERRMNEELARIAQD